MKPRITSAWVHEGFEALWQEDERTLYRGTREDAQHAPMPVLVVALTDRAGEGAAQRLANEFHFRAYLDPRWAVQPIDLLHEGKALVLRDPGGHLLADLIDERLSIQRFVTLASAVAEAVRAMHEQGVLHGDLKPSHVFIGSTAEQACTATLTGFGLGSRIEDKDGAMHRPALSAGTLAYMAPEQTGRMNRPADARSDLYSLGVTFFQLLTGRLPFTADDPLGWIHSHLALKPPMVSDWRPDVPQVLVKIIAKLLEKNPDQRYQSAKSLCSDLVFCGEQLSQHGRIPVFPLAATEKPLYIGLQGALYGRDAELQALRSALASVAETGERRVVFVSGPAGIGKSTLVNRLAEDAWARNGFFASGKLDQYDRGTPYAALAAALRSLVRHLMGRDDDELKRWQETMQAAVGNGGSLVTRLVPEAKVLIADTQDIAEPAGLAARGYFINVFRRFVAAFARQDRPLVLFLDDLQWLDAASLEVIESLATHPDVRSLLLILAYRGNEVAAASPIAAQLDRVRRSHPELIDVQLAELCDDSAAQMVASALQAPVEDLAELIEFIFRKTDKNPFVLTHFLSSLAEKGLIRRDAETARWTWDTDRIRLMEVADNIGEILVDRLGRLTTATLKALQTFAALGNACHREKLGIALGMDTTALKQHLDDAVQAGLLLNAVNRYQFAHDRIREAAYATIGEAQRSALHWQIGRRLQRHLGGDGVDTDVFEVAAQLNRASPEVGERGALREVAALNLEAGRAARRTAAYKEACSYLAAGRRWLAHQGSTEKSLAFSLLLEHAECVFLGGEQDDARLMVDELLGSAQDDLEFAAASRLKIELCVVQSQHDEAVLASIAGLERLGISISARPSAETVRELYDGILSRLPQAPLAWIRDAPRMTDPRTIAAMRLLAETWPPAVLTDANLTTAVACHLVDLSLSHGFTEASAQGFAVLGWLLGPMCGHYEQGYQLTLAATTAALERCTPVQSGRICVTLALTAPWTRPLEVAVEWGRRAYQLLVEGGDVYYAAYAANNVSNALFMQGRDLNVASIEVRKYLRFAADTGFRDGYAMVAPFERAIACLRGETRHLSDLSQDDFDQESFEAEITAGNVPLITQQYWATRTMLHFLGGEFEAAHEASSRFLLGHYNQLAPVSHLDYRYFAGLTIAALIDRQPSTALPLLRQQLASHISAIAEWKERAGASIFEDRLCLLQAEAARVDGRLLEAETLYEESARLARENGFLQSEAIACELASRFHRGRGLERIASMYLQDAVDAYQRWGALAKTQLLRAEHPTLSQSIGLAAARDHPPAERIDLKSLLKRSQAVREEHPVDQLVLMLIRTAAEYAGAQCAVLLLTRSGALEAVAETFTDDNALVVSLVRRDEGMVRIPLTAIRYVQRTGESLVVEDALADSRFSRDPHVSGHRVRSMMCLPVVRNGSMQAILYLENNLASHLFTDSHVELLTLLATQCTISMENARLYADLQAREAKIRRIFDLNIIGMVFWDLNGVCLDANDAFLEMLGRSRDELESGLLRWYDMTPPEWQLQVPRELQELNETGALRPIEKEFFHKNGDRVPVLMSAAFFDGTQQQGVAIIVDTRKQKAAEARTIEAERRNRLLHVELAHAARVATMGHMAGWIAHDVKQPLAGIAASGNAALRWLKADPPNIAAAERATERTVRDAMRAASVLDRTRALVKKVSPEPDLIDIDAVIAETLALVASEARHKQIELQHELGAGALKAVADQIQIQQVVLNLVVNSMEALSNSPHQDVRTLVVSSEALESKQVLVSVRDNGPGLPTAREEDCFEAFFTTKAEGLGLGLSICRSIVESYGGSITAAPNLPRGAVLRFVLPAVQA